MAQNLSFQLNQLVNKLIFLKCLCGMTVYLKIFKILTQFAILGEIIFKRSIIMSNYLKKLAILLAFSTVLVTTQIFAVVCGVVTTNKDPLNIRAGSTQTTKVISQAAKGSVLRILSSSKAWYKVKLNNGKVGYGSADYIEELTARSPEKCGIVVTKKTPLNIRKAPNHRATVIAKAYKGSALRILDWGNWYRVKLNNGKIGYASSDYVR